MDNNNGKEGFCSPRFVIALVVSSLALASIVTFGIIDVVKSTETADAAKDVLTMTLPVLGTWVATVLAYYFHKENLDAATKGMTDIVKQFKTSEEKLQSIQVKDKMIPKNEMYFEPWLLSKPIILFAAIARLKKSGKGQRIPVLDDKGCIKYMMHLSKIEEYLKRKACEFLADKSRIPGDNPTESLTLDGLLNDDPGLKWLFETSFGTVAEGATLADAKKVMDLTPMCQDVFVTKKGTRDEEVIGWLTNVIIAENSQV